MGWVNRQRRYSALDYLSPKQFEVLKISKIVLSVNCSKITAK